MKQYPPLRACKTRTGFTLVEMAIVLAILGLVIGGGLMLLGAQIETQREKDTQKLLEEAREALIGFAAANGRLPCPATAPSNGRESTTAPGNGICTNASDGFLPAVTLGLSGVDDTGTLRDAWGTPANRIRYAVTDVNTNAATRVDGIRDTPLNTFAASTDHLHVCASATGITATTCGPAANTLTNNAIAVIYSLGRTAPQGARGADETSNLPAADRFFVSHPPTEAGAPNGAFDDIVIWLPGTILYNRMIQAGRL